MSILPEVVLSFYYLWFLVYKNFTLSAKLKFLWKFPEYLMHLYNTHPSLLKKFVGKKVRIIPEILRYLFFIFCSNISQAEENPQAATAQQSLAVLKARDQFNKILFAALVKKVCNYSCLRSVEITTKTTYWHRLCYLLTYLLCVGLSWSCYGMEAEI